MKTYYHLQVWEENCLIPIEIDTDIFLTDDEVIEYAIDMGIINSDIGKCVDYVTKITIEEYNNIIDH